jgi:acetyl esterase/lipase
MLSHFVRRVWVISLVCGGAWLAEAAPKEEEVRNTPVPAEQPIPAGDFFRPRLFSHPRLNAAGTHFAALVSNNPHQRQLGVFEIATKKIERLGGAKNFDISSFRWQNDRQITFSILRDRYWDEGLFLTEVGKLSQVTPIQRFNLLYTIGRPKDKPHELIVWMPASLGENYSDGGLVRIDLRATSVFGEQGDGMRAEIVHRYVTPTGGSVRDYWTDNDGEVAYAVLARDGLRKLHYWKDGAWQVSPVDLTKTVCEDIGEKPFEILVTAPTGPGKPLGLYRMNVITGEQGALVHADERYDLVDVYVNRRRESGEIIGIDYERKGLHTVWLDPKRAEMQASLEQSFPKSIVNILGSDRAEKLFVIEVRSDVRPSSYYQYDREKAEVRVLAHAAPWLDPERMRPMQVVNYKARDGREIEGFLTLPAGASKQSPAPLVVTPHGGPHSRDSWGWDPEVQFLASRGYAVFQPNYRGSPGYSWRFSDEDMWDFVKMHHDVTDGVHALFKTGLIDRDRVAIMGGSFGGYLALCGAADEGPLYRCAISMAGVFDWEEIVDDARSSGYRNQYQYLLRKLGDPDKLKEKFKTFSPIYRVAQIKIPVLVAHGTRDRVSPVGQSKALVDELEKHGVPHEVLFRTEPHGFQKYENQVDYYTAVEAFLAKHLAPRAAVAAAK